MVVFVLASRKTVSHLRDQKFQVAPEYLTLTFHSWNLSYFQIVCF
jgi:hypothetical protein